MSTYSVLSTKGATNDNLHDDVKRARNGDWLSRRERLSTERFDGARTRQARASPAGRDHLRPLSGEQRGGPVNERGIKTVYVVDLATDSLTQREALAPVVQS